MGSAFSAVMDLLSLVAEIGSEAPEGQIDSFRFLQIVLQAVIGAGIIKFAKEDRALIYSMPSVMFLWVDESGIYSGFRGVGLGFLVQLLIAVVLVRFFKLSPRTSIQTGPELEPERGSPANESS